MERLAAQNLDVAYAADFNWDFASQSAEDFIRNVLIDGLGAVHVVVGYDFCFGQLRKGSAQTLKDSSLPVTVVEKIIAEDGDDKLSSSAIRQHIRHGKISEANAVLGWNWEIVGEVIKGDQRGRELGYPTANFDLCDTVHPAYGIYATMARIEGEDTWHPSATNIGIRPMFEVEAAQVETFIFDFDREIYGKRLHVRPVQYLRGEAKFDSLEDLITQMDKDCAQAREILSSV
jgi:riboflavin kinase/FMN adenylyltransferase